MSLTGPAFRRLWITGIGLGVAVIVAVSLWSIPAPSLAGGRDKVGHFLAYFLLALFSSGIVAPARLWRLVLRCLLLGIGLEAAQFLFTETRQAEWPDMAANAAGVLAAWMIAAGGRAGWARHVEAWLSRRTGR